MSVLTIPSQHEPLRTCLVREVSERFEGSDITEAFEAGPIAITRERFRKASRSAWHGKVLGSRKRPIKSSR